MSFASDIRNLELEIATEVGQSAVLHHVTSSTYETDGTVTTTETTHTVQVDGPVSEASRYAASSTDTAATATFYVPALGLTVVPAKADRIVAGGKTWLVVAVEAFYAQGLATSYRCDCAEVAASG